MKTCPKCGFLNSEDGRYCMKCGSSLGNLDAQGVTVGVIAPNRVITLRKMKVFTGKYVETMEDVINEWIEMKSNERNNFKVVDTHVVVDDGGVNVVVFYDEDGSSS